MKVLGVEVPPAQVEKEPVLYVPAIDMTDDATPEPVVKATRPTFSPRPSLRSRRSGGRQPSGQFARRRPSVRLLVQPRWMHPSAPATALYTGRRSRRSRRCSSRGRTRLEPSSWLRPIPAGTSGASRPLTTAELTLAGP